MIFGLLAVLVRSDLSKDAELLVLRHENRVLRRHLAGTGKPEPHQPTSVTGCRRRWLP
jgi:hypothetical protein